MSCLLLLHGSCYNPIIEKKASRAQRIHQSQCWCLAVLQDSLLREEHSRSASIGVGADWFVYLTA